MVATNEIRGAEIAAAEALIRPHIRRTPTITVAGSDFDLPVHEIAFKLEQLQHSGSFKVRGAFANLLMRDMPGAGVVAASGGNHGAAVAFAARRLGIRATIFVPSVAAPAKIEAIGRSGAELVIAGERYADALGASEEHARRTGALEVHAFDQRETLIGQGTLGMEIEQDLPTLDTLLVAVGGGGLIGGMAAWLAGRVRLIAVEPEAAPTLYDALRAGEPVDAPAGGLAADSLAPRRVGTLMFPLAQAHVAESVLVSDAAIANAQELLWERLRVVIEPGGAAAFSALLSGRYRPAPGERVGVLLCGGNTSAVAFRPAAAA